MGGKLTWCSRAELARPPTYPPKQDQGYGRNDCAKEEAIWITAVKREGHRQSRQ